MSDLTAAQPLDPETTVPKEEESYEIPSDLRAPCEDVVFPPGTADPEGLPFSVRTPRDFERCCLVVVEQVDGLRDARLYGVPGQAQHGIDIVGWDGEGGTVVYQVKRYEEFTVADLKAAVRRFQRDRRPFRPRRFVVCVSSTVDRTQFIEVLDNLRREVDFELDLYDQTRLSEMLRGRPDVVRRLFGEAWVSVFNRGVLPEPPAPHRTDLLADSVLRGPLRAVGLVEALRDAETAAASGDHDRATAFYRTVVQGLESSEFSALADGPRRRLVAELLEAGARDEAAGILARMAWIAVADNGRHPDLEAQRQLDELAESVPELRPLAGLLGAIAAWYGAPSDDLSGLVELLADVGPDCRLLDELLLWVAESAVAVQDSATLGALVEPLGGLIDRRGPAGFDDEVLVRARCCLADATGEWGDLVRAARRGDLGPRLASLVFARRGRWLAWHARPDEGADAYREAVQSSCTAHLGIEAGEAVRSSAQIGFRYGPLTEDAFNAPRIATRLDADGGGLFGQVRDLVDAGLAAMAVGRHPDALRMLRSALRSHVIAGHFDSELGAHKALARVLGAADVPEVAMRHATLGGADDIAKGTSLVVGLPSLEELTAPAPWVRAVALSVLARHGDVVPDNEVPALVELALDAVEGVRQMPTGPQVHLAAWRVLAALSARLSEEHAERVLNKLGTQISREPGHYHHNDDEHVRIVANVHRIHPTLRRLTTPHLLDLIALGNEVAESVRREASNLIDAHAAVFAPTLQQQADDGNRVAVALLVDIDKPTQAVLDQAQAAADSVLARGDPVPGHFSFGTRLSRSAYLARVSSERTREAVALRLMEEAEDGRRPDPNRVEAIEAVRALADRLGAELRHECFERCMALARDPGPPHPFDAELQGSLHPLSAFRIDLGFGVFAVEAARTAAWLADTVEEHRGVCEFLAPLVVSNDERVAYVASHGLSRVPPDRLTVDVRMLAATTNSWPRQLAAAAWVHRPDDAPELGQRLASDPDPRVRRVIASGLQRLRETDQALATELANTLAADSCWSVRRAVLAIDEISDPEGN